MEPPPPQAAAADADATIGWKDVGGVDLDALVETHIETHITAAPQEKVSGTTDWNNAGVGVNLDDLIDSTLGTTVTAVVAAVRWEKKAGVGRHRTGSK
jgi:hypothetical protein